MTLAPLLNITYIQLGKSPNSYLQAKHKISPSHIHMKMHVIVWRYTASTDTFQKQCRIGTIIMTQPSFFIWEKLLVCKISKSLCSQDWPELVHLKAEISLMQLFFWLFWPEIQLLKVRVTCIVYIRATAPCSLIIVLWWHAGKCCLATNILPPSLW